MAKSRVVRKSGAFTGEEGLDKNVASMALAETVALRPGEEVESVEILSDKVRTKVSLVSNKGKGQMVYRVTGFSDGPTDIPSLVEARKVVRERLKETPGASVSIDKVVLKEGKPVGEGTSELISRRMTVAVTVTKD
jgi:hypothetical protein